MYKGEVILKDVGLKIYMGDNINEILKKIYNENDTNNIDSIHIQDLDADKKKNKKR